MKKHRLFFLLFLLPFLFSFTWNGATLATWNGATLATWNGAPISTYDVSVTKTIYNGDDDCLVFYSSSWSFNLPSIYQNIGDSVHKYGGGLRFRSVNIPAGATIVEAKITTTSGFALSSGIKSYITGELSGTPAVFSNLANYQARRGTVVGGANDSQRTVSQVAWDTIISGVNVSPDIKTVIQEIVDTVGAVTNLVVFVDDHDGRSDSGAYFFSDAYESSASDTFSINIKYNNP